MDRDCIQPKNGQGIRILAVCDGGLFYKRLEIASTNMGRSVKRQGPKRIKIGASRSSKIQRVLLGNFSENNHPKASQGDFSGFFCLP